MKIRSGRRHDLIRGRRTALQGTVHCSSVSRDAGMFPRKVQRSIDRRRDVGGGAQRVCGRVAIGAEDEHIEMIARIGVHELIGVQERGATFARMDSNTAVSMGLVR